MRRARAGAQVCRLCPRRRAALRPQSRAPAAAVAADVPVTTGQAAGLQQRRCSAAPAAAAAARVTLCSARRRRWRSLRGAAEQAHKMQAAVMRARLWTAKRALRRAAAAAQGGMAQARRRRAVRGSLWLAAIVTAPGGSANRGPSAAAAQKEALGARAFDSEAGVTWPASKAGEAAGRSVLPARRACLSAGHHPWASLPASSRGRFSQCCMRPCKRPAYHASSRTAHEVGGGRQDGQRCGERTGVHPAKINPYGPLGLGAQSCHSASPCPGVVGFSHVALAP